MKTKKRRIVAGLVTLLMLVCSSMSVFAAETPEQNSAPLEKIEDLSFSSLSEDANISIQGEQVTEAEPYVLPLEQNDMRQVGIEAYPIAYNPTTGHLGVFNNYAQAFTNPNMSEFFWAYVYVDEMKTIEDFYKANGYQIVGWRTVASYYFKMDRPVDYYYSCNGSAEQRVPLSVNDNMQLFQCTFDKLLDAGEGDGLYTSAFRGRFGHRIDSGATVYASFNNGISFNVSR